MVVTGVIRVAQGHLLAEVRLLGFVGMLALLVASLAAGWLLGGPGSDSRKTLALTTSLRNVGVNLHPDDAPHTRGLNWRVRVTPS